MKDRELDFEGIEEQPLRQFTEKAYLDYSMYVILDRALPHVGDGLKPVQRRIVFSMRELGLGATAKPKKSARTVGDVIGKFHPHGDLACYEAMVHMAQPFTYRYPLVDGHGNWGSPDDPKSFAAMRYTEARLTPYAALLLAEVEQGTVDWIPNFDGTLREPSLLPARLPNVLLNGATGIAVGMSTDIPPHNLREVAAALIRLLDKPDVSTPALMEYIVGPDFPTGAELVTPPGELLELYSRGSGTLRMRACYEVEQGEVVITELPYQVSGNRVLEQIAAQMQARKLPMVEDLRDESDHENPTRLVISPRSSRVDLEALMAHLFATTDLEKTLRVNINVIQRDGRPAVLDLKTLLVEWLEFRLETTRRRLAFRLDKVEQRLHLLDGLLIAYLNIDEVIAIIRGEDKPKAVLMRRFSLSDAQAEAILELRLRHLARLEEMKIRTEQKELDAERADLRRTLGSKRRLKSLVKREIEADAERHGDERRTRLVQRPAARAMDASALVPNEAVTVVLSQRGWARAAKGHDVDPASLNYRGGDAFLSAARARSNQQAVFLDSTGRVYTLSIHGLPSARGQGEPLSGRLNPPDGARFCGVMAREEAQRWVIATSAGFGFVARVDDLYSRNKAGRAAVTVPAGAGVLIPAPVPGGRSASIAATTSSGRLLVFPLEELPELARGKGNKIVGIPSAKFKAGEESLEHVTVLPAGSDLLVFSGQRQMTLRHRDLEAYRGQRGRRGALLPRGWRRVDALAPATRAEEPGQQ